ncbi:hypothetical protein B0H34DRAFT_198064 [Crassisporium funariophilum]|nr:hypothetical protein B0H34DRAFT_198064 [Crassisporium funariophilum]
MSLKPIQISALLGSGILTGGIFSISAFVIPSLLSPYSSKDINKRQALLPAKTLQIQWQDLYDSGKRFYPSLAVVTSSAYLYLAYNSPNTRPLYLVSAFFSVSIVPYTLLGMMGNIKKIQAEIKEEDAPRLGRDIAKWAKLNYGRAALQFVGFLVGIYAVMDSA